MRLQNFVAFMLQKAMYKKRLRYNVSQQKTPNTDTRAAMAEADDIVRTHRARFETARELFDEIEKNGSR